MKAVVTVILLLIGTSVPAQQSDGYRLTEVSINTGGRPFDGVIFSSPSYRVTVDALGESVSGPGLTSPAFRLEAGFVPAPPAGEVMDLQFLDVCTVSWHAERSSSRYDLYRDDTSDGYGNCEQRTLASESTSDTAAPDPGAAFFYLVTGRNRLGREGTKGRRSDGTERMGSLAPGECPVDPDPLVCP